MTDRDVSHRLSALVVLTLSFLSAQMLASPVVFGPKAYAVAAHQEKEFSETIAFNGPCDTPKAVYTLVVTNGAANGTGRVKDGSLSFNGEEVISDDDLSKATGAIEKVIAVKSSSQLKIELKGGNSDGSISVSISRHIDLTASVFGDKSYTLTSSKSDAFDDAFAIADVTGRFTFVLQNGNGSILPVDDARVTLNGVEIISKKDIDSRGNQNGDPNSPQIIQRDVALKAQNTLHLELKTNKTPAGVVVRVLRHLTDTQGPVITLNGLHDQQLVRVSPLNITGTVTDDSGVSAFSINGVAVPLGNGGTFQRSVSLVSGPNTVTLAASDCEGNSRQQQITIILDNTPPQVAILTPAEGAFSKTATIVVTGTASDASGIASVVVNGVAATLSGNNWTASVTFPPVGGTVDGSKTVAAVATDGAGNQSTAQVHVVIDTTAPTISAAVQPAPNAAGWNRAAVTVSFTCADAGSGVVACPDPVTVSTDTPGQTISRSIADRAGNSGMVSVTIKLDTASPVLTVAFPQDPVSRYYAKGGGGTGTTIIGDVADALSGIDSVTCNGAPATVTGQTYQCSVTLAAGANTVTVKATDRAGNSSVVTRQLTLTIDDVPPTIIVAPLPAPSAAGWIRGPVTVDFICSDNQVVAVCNGRRYLNDGANQVVTGLALDAVGNQATTSVTLNVDGTPPLLNVTSSHDVLTNQATLHVTGTASDALSGLAGVKCNGIAATLSAGAFDCTVTLSAGSQTIVVTATDLADNQTSEQVSAKLDQTPPQITLIEPSASVTTNRPTLVITGTATDDDQVQSLTVAGNAVSLSGDTFSATVSLSEGLNHIEIRAVDRAGNATVTSIDVRYVPRGAVAITSPADLAVLHSTTVTVAGTVSGPIASVQINGIAASLSGTSFTASGVPLLQGRTVITATATTSGGQVSTASINVYRDSIPPRLTVYSPPANSDVDTTAAIVSGMVDDIVVGTINAGQVRVTVNGLPAQVVNRTFKASNVTITPGMNTIIVTATDQGGNTITVSHSVRGVAPAGARLAIQSGNDQSGTIGTALAAPLRVRALDASGNPVVGKPVYFSVAVNNGSVAAGALAGRQITVVTDAQGDATATWTLGTRAGVANQRVDVTAAGYRKAQFFASGTIGSPARIVVDMGNNQFGVTSERLPRPLVVAVVDAGGNRLNDVPVTFSVTDGGGSFDGQRSVVIRTDSDGRAWTAPTLGASAGADNNIFWAFVPGVAAPAVFNASSSAAGPAAETKVSGVVLDNTSTPVPGVTMRIEGTSLVTQTDAQGQFLLQPAPIGYVRLIADGSTAQRPGTWPSLEFATYTNSGQNNTIGMPIFLLPIDVTRGVQVDEQHGGTITLPELPGFSLTIAPGATTFPGGLRTGTVSATLVHNDKMPMTPGFGQQPRFLVTIQPPGALFDPPAALTIPNVDGFGAGQITELYSFDHDLGQFVAIGTGSVTADGTTVSSDPGVGIIKAGWHCGGDPAGTGTTGCIQVELDVEDDVGASGAALPPGKRLHAQTTAKTVGGGPQGKVGLTGPKTALINTCMKLIATGKPGGGSPPVGDTSYSWSIVSGTASFVDQPSCPNAPTCEARIKATDPSDVVVRVTYTSAQGSDKKDATIKFVKLTMEISELSYLNDLSIVKDVAGSITPVSDPVWKKGRADNDRVAYVGNFDGGSRKIKVKAVFEINPPLPDDVKNLDLVGEVPSDPGGFPGGKLTKKNVTIKKNQQKLTVDDFDVDFTLPRTTYYFNKMAIKWSLKPNNACADDSSKVDLKTSEVVVYVTLAAPTTSPIYLSLLHIALAGPPAGSLQAAVDNTWLKFGSGSGPNDVKGWDDRPFVYYKTGHKFDDVELSDFEGFLKSSLSGGGRCGMMAELMDRALHINGISSRIVTVNPAAGAPDPAHPTAFFAHGFIVKNWTYTEPGRFAAAPLLPGFKYLWKTPDLSSSNEIQPEPADENYGDLTNGFGAAGQNSPNPSEKAWGDHAIIEVPASTGITHRWLDSSYGKEYADEADFQGQSLVGFYVGITLGGASASPDPRNHAARKPEPGVTGVIFH